MSDWQLSSNTVEFRREERLSANRGEQIPHPKKPKRPPHWYRIHVGECPVCGSDKSYRERVYGERPENVEDRYEYIPDTITFDNCIY